MAGFLDALEQQVAEVQAVEQSAVTLIEGLADKIESMQGDPAQLAVLVATLRDSSNALSAAVVANTPAAPVPPTGSAG